MKSLWLLQIIISIHVTCFYDIDLKLNFNGLIRKYTQKKKIFLDAPRELFISKVNANILNRSQIEDISKLRDFIDGDSQYVLQKKIGKGAFSQVYLGYSVKQGNRVVLKILNSIRQSIINREIAILSYLQGASPHIVKMVDAVRYPQNSTATIVYEYMDSIVFKKIANKIDFEEFKTYFYQLLLAVDASHKRGVIHRDIKLGNTIVNEKTKHLLLIDWGQADFYYPLKRMNCGIGTIHYKAPELLLNFSYYDYAADMFSIGVVLAGQVFQKSPFFRNAERKNIKLNYLKSITKYLGSEKLTDYLRKYKIELSREKLDFIGWQNGISWGSIKLTNRIVKQPELAIDLVSKLVIFDHKERLTAEEALNHPFFDSIRKIQ